MVDVASLPDPSAMIVVSVYPINMPGVLGVNVSQAGRVSLSKHELVDVLKSAIEIVEDNDDQGRSVFDGSP